MNAFVTKLTLFKDGFSADHPNLAHFPSCEEMRKDAPECEKTLPKYRADIETLQQQFKKRFQDFHTMQPRIELFTNPLSAAIIEQPPELQLEIRGREAALKEARQEVACKPWLRSWLPEWLQLFTSSPENLSQASNPFLGYDLVLGGPRILRKVSGRCKAKIPARTPVPAPFPDPVQEPFAGTRLAFGGPRSLQKAPKRRSRKSRLAARAPEAMLWAPVLAPAAMVSAPAAMVPAP
ncbi:hypothetical protein F7725_021411 [Dissostichus mawsoni]|uniref:Uncharacterized protein n=1 Tax=Dissostichus mawsoni TaxID=36200 RepID=A0A7J5ZB34_DISMA|nr:hypothetical protein F7725_021411 [Dissostichus mawsoni]